MDYYFYVDGVTVCVGVDAQLLLASSTSALWEEGEVVVDSGRSATTTSGMFVGAVSVSDVIDSRLE